MATASSRDAAAESAESATRGIGALYRSAVESFIDFARTLSDDDWATPTPCTPGWTARDVLSHVSGIPDDALAGRLDGVATDPWTAAQVERNAHFTVGELLERWMEQYDVFADAIESMGQGRPPFDCHCHEHDIRHALGRPGSRQHPVLAAIESDAAGSLAEAPAAFTISFADGDTYATGAGGPAVALSIGRFEYFRSRLGRRSRRQLEAYDWSGDPAAVAAIQDRWWFFGVAAEDVIE